MSFRTSKYYVDTTPAAADLAEAVAKSDSVAVDTEADSLHHYFEKLCLLQISVNDEHYIVDPLAGADLSPLVKALSSRLMILHGADYDLRLLKRSFKFEPAEVFDTMLAGQLLGYQQIGLAALVERHFGAALCKKGQRSDWSRRPLTDEQLEYAVNDTRYLHALAKLFATELDKLGRRDWHREMCTHLIKTVTDSAPVDVDQDRAWRIRGWMKLRSKRARAILREVWFWRDAEARAADKAPFKFLANDAMIEIAAWAEHNDNLDEIPRLSWNCSKGRRFRDLKDAILRAKSLPESELPLPVGAPPRIPAPADEHIVLALRKVRDDLAAQLQIEPAILAPAGSITAIARANPANPEEVQKAGDLYDWQTGLLSEGFLQVLADPALRSNGSRRRKPAVAAASAAPVEAEAPAEANTPE